MFMFGIHVRAIVEGFESHPRCGICSCDGRNRAGAPEEAPRTVQPAVERWALQPPINDVGSTAPSMPRTRFCSMPAWATTPSIATSRCAPARPIDRMNRSHRANWRECDGPHAPPRAWTAEHNLPFSGKPKALGRHAIFDDPCCLNFRRSPSPFGHGAGVAYACGQGIVRTGEAAMAKVLNEILLFSSMAVFVTGIVLAAARLLI